MRLELRAHCKVNLLLNVLGRRADGFHELETVLHPVPVFDRLEIATADHGIDLFCSDPSLPSDCTNLVVRAAEAFRARASVSTGLRIRLEKVIPVAAGLGGGSSDAAFTLIGLNELFGQPLESGELHCLAAELGSDVPFFLCSRPALATGRGERIAPLEWFDALKGVWLLLIRPGFGISTAWAYSNLARFPAALNGTPGRADRLLEQLRLGNVGGAAALFYNSLETPVLAKFPILALYQQFLRAEGAMGTLMSGSGSASFALLPDEETARRIHDRFKAKFGEDCWTALAPMDKW